METIKAIKPGPKPDNADGTPDKRRRVTPELKPPPHYRTNLFVWF